MEINLYFSKTTNFELFEIFLVALYFEVFLVFWAFWWLVPRAYQTACSPARMRNAPLHPCVSQSVCVRLSGSPLLPSDWPQTQPDCLRLSRSPLPPSDWLQTYSEPQLTITEWYQSHLRMCAETLFGTVNIERFCCELLILRLPNSIPSIILYWYRNKCLSSITGNRDYIVFLITPKIHPKTFIHTQILWYFHHHRFNPNPSGGDRDLTPLLPTSKPLPTYLR